MKVLQAIVIICFSTLLYGSSLNTIPAPSQFYIQKRFIYLVTWNGIPVGRVIAECKNIEEYKGYKVQVVKIMTESNKFLSMIYKIEDAYTSYIDVKTMTSRRYEANRKEGRYRKHVVVEYDFEKNEAIYTSFTDGSVKTCSIKENVQDPVSAMCFFMMLPLEVDQKINFTVNLNEKNYELFGRIEDAGMIESAYLGSFPVFKVRPYAELNLKRVKKGSGWMYFSADEKRLPFCGVILIPFGKVVATLQRIEDISD